MTHNIILLLCLAFAVAVSWFVIHQMELVKYPIVQVAKVIGLIIAAIYAVVLILRIFSGV